MTAIKPVKDGYITSGYGERVSPFGGKKEFHPGIDIGSKDKNPPVYAPLSGVVAVHGYSVTFGYRVWIKLPDGYYYVLAHLKEISPLIKTGLTVLAGDHIGLMGNTGLSKGQHLHYEERLNPSKPGNSREPKEVIATFK